jgi:hypothetical protein
VNNKNLISAILQHQRSRENAARSKFPLLKFNIICRTLDFQTNRVMYFSQWRGDNQME